MLNAETQSQAAGDGRFRLAMSSSGIGMAIVDLDGRWIEVNPAFERMLGRTAADVVGHPAAEVTHPEDIGVSDEYLRRLVSGELPVLDVQKRYLHRDGGIVWAHANVAVMRDAQGSPCYLIVQLRDITAQRATEEALRSLNASLEERVQDSTAELERANRQQELFAYGISHDLRAPLRAIDSFAGLLESQYGDRLEPVARGYVARIRNAATRMGGLIDSLLELSRASRTDLRSDTVDLSMLADWGIAELRDADPAREADVHVQQGLLVKGDERQLRQLLAQLLQNAWKFSRGRDRVRIEVTGKRRDGRLQVSVRDHGVGFDERYAERMFEPFQRLHGNDEAGGNGLGLAIATRIAERHRGRLWAESELGVGSVFHLDLPVADPGDATAR